jgi:hypothetical protein
VKKGKKNNKEVTLHGNSEFRSSQQMSSQVAGDADPGVISEGESEDDFTVSRIFGLSENIEELNFCE